MKSILTNLLLLAIAITTNAQTKSNTAKKDSVKVYKLNEVNIKNKTSAIAVLTNKVQLNVESMPGTLGLNALEVLKQSPGISADGQDNLKMAGKKGIQVMIDGRLQQLSGQQLTSLLKATPASNIRTIELISNPSAKYDAAGNAGIINIILKRPPGDGTTANLAAGYQFTTHFRQNASASLNSRKGKLLFFGSGSYDNSLQHTKVSSKRITPQYTFAQSGIEQQGYSNPNLRAGLEYSINEKVNLGAIIQLAHEWEDFPSDAITLVSGTTTSNLSTHTLASAIQNRFGANLNYQYKPNKKNELRAETDLTTYHSSLANEVKSLLNGSGTAGFNNYTKSEINLYSLKADYSYTNESYQIESGIKASVSRTGNLLAATQSGSIQAPSSITDFSYRENIYASYSSITQQYKKWSFQAGIRSELTQMLGQVTALKTPIRDTSYINLFPSLFVRYAISQKHSIGLNYARRIDRPNFQDQNPYTYRTDLYYATVGNPLLLPQFTQSISLDFAYNSQLQVKATYSTTSELIETITTQIGQQTLALPINAGKRQLINLSLSSPFKIGNYWSGYINIEPNYQFYNANLSAYPGLVKITTKGAGINGSLGNTFTLSPTLKVGISSWLSYASRSSIYINHPIYSIDLSAKKTILKSKGTIGLAYRDLLNSQKVTSRALAGEIDQTSQRKWESQGAYISLSYNLGNTKIRNSSSSKGTTDEQQRIKGKN